MKYLLIAISAVLASAFFTLIPPAISKAAQTNPTIWRIQSMDTMKVSRDGARAPISDEQITQELSVIKNTGANYVAIATPYDEEFYPVLKRWSDIAHEMGLSVWFRGNFSGWEGWFDYPKDLTRSQHLEKTRAFILNHPDLFQDGDSFTGCPECENGGPGDPRMTRDFIGHRQFLINQYKAANAAFAQINKKVHTNWFSMNGDIAKEVMDKETYAAIGNLATIDHYVATPQRFESDLLHLHQKFGVNILLGEFGAPIPDLHGVLDQKQQAELIERFIEVMYTHRSFVIGMNYWTSRYGSTAVFDDDLLPKRAVETITAFWQPGIVTGRVRNTLLQPVAQVEVGDQEHKTITDENGDFALVLPARDFMLEFSKSSYVSQSTPVTVTQNSEQEVNIFLEPEEPTLWYKTRERMYRLLENMQKVSQLPQRFKRFLSVI